MIVSPLLKTIAFNPRDLPADPNPGAWPDETTPPQGKSELLTEITNALEKSKTTIKNAKDAAEHNKKAQDLSGAGDSNEPNSAVERPVGITTFVDAMETTFELQPQTRVYSQKLMGPDEESNSIEKFLNRPTFMNELTWDSSQVAGTLIKQYGIPTSVIDLSQMKIDKLQYNQFLNCDVVIRLQASPIQLQSGRLWLCFEPYRAARGARSQDGHPNQFTALHGVALDPCQPTPMELRVPFASVVTSWELTSRQFGFGTILIYVLSPLRSATATNSMTISVQGWLENTKLRVPTAVGYTVPTPVATVASPLQYQSNTESMKAQKHLYSQTFSRISKIATALGHFPTLASVAQPVAFFASMASNIASYFGFSKPADTTPPTKVMLHNRVNWTNGDGPLPLGKLALSVENAVDHTGNHFPNEVDEMDISYIVSNPVMLNQWEWSTSDTPGKLITVIPVHPGLSNYIEDTNKSYTFGSFSPTPLSYVASMFKYWAGSMKFKMEVVATPFHAGRLVVAYIPDYEPLNIGINIQDIGNNYSVVWDIADSSHIEFEVPYLGNTPFLDVVLDDQTFKVLTADETDTSVVKSRVRKVANGAIIVFVLNSLVAPAVTSSTISVMNWVAGGRDMTFAEPVLGAYKPVDVGAKRIDYTSKWYDGSDMSEAPLPVLPTGTVAAATGGFDVVDAPMQYQSNPMVGFPKGVDPTNSTAAQRTNYANFIPMHYIDPKERAKMCCGEVVTNLRVLTRRLTPAYAMYPQNVTTAGAWGNNATPPSSLNVLVLDPDYFGTGEGQGDDAIYKKQIAPARKGHTNWLTELDSALSYVGRLYAFARGSRLYGISARPSNVINATAFGTLSDEIDNPTELATFEFRLSTLVEEDTPPRQPYFRPEDNLIGYNYSNTSSSSLSATNYSYGFNSYLQGNFAIEKSGEAGCGLVVQVPPTSRYPFKIVTTPTNTEVENIKGIKNGAPRSRRFVELRYRPFSSTLSGATSTYTPKVWPFPLTIMEAGADDFSFGGLVPPPIITKVAKTNSFPNYTTGAKVLV